MGHLNDTQTFGLMRRIGTELGYPEQCVLLGDKIYPNGNCIMTPYTAAQLARKEDRMKRKCKKLNRNIRYCRIGVEHAFEELKQYKITSSVWRHSRPLLSQLVTICAGLVCRKKLDAGTYKLCRNKLACASSKFISLKHSLTRVFDVRYMDILFVRAIITVSR